MGIFDVKAERVEIKINEARVMELEAQMFEAERVRARQSWRDNTLEAELAEAEESERRAYIKERDHVRLLEEKRWYFNTLVYSVDRMAG